MLNSKDAKLGSRDLIALICISIGVKYTDMTVVMMYNEGLNATWMIPLFSTAFLILPYLALLSLLKKYDMNFIELIHFLTGKYIGFILSMILFIITMTATFVNSASYSYIMHSIYMPRTPMYAINGIGWLTVFAITYIGFKSFTKGNYILFWYIKFFTVIFLILAYMEGTFANLLPIFGPGLDELLKHVPSNSSVFGDLFYLTVFYNYFRNHNEYRKGSLIGFIIVLLELTIIFGVFAMIYYYPSLTKMKYPFQQVTMNVGLGRFITNLEIFFLGYWIVTGVLRFTIYIFTAVHILAYTLNIKEIKYLYLPCISIVFLLGFIPDNQIDLIFTFREGFLYKNTWVTITILPISLWIISFIKGGKKGEAGSK